MAALNLIPSPVVLVTQIGVFLANYVVIKKLFVQPYVKVRDRRLAMTVGSKDEAAKALASCQEIATSIDSRLSAAAKEARGARDKSREAALAKRESVISAAQTLARAEVAKVEQTIAHDLAAEKLKIPSIVKQLTEEVYALALA